MKAYIISSTRPVVHRWSELKEVRGLYYRESGCGKRTLDDKLDINIGAIRPCNKCNQRAAPSAPEATPPEA